MWLQSHLISVSAAITFIYDVQKDPSSKNTLLDSKFRVTHFLECEAGENYNIFYTSEEFFLAVIWTQDMLEEYCWVITDTWVVMLWQIRFPFHGDWISTGLPCTYLYILPHVYSIMTCVKLDLRWNFWNITTV